MQNGLFILDARKAYGLPVDVKEVPFEAIASISPNPIQEDIVFSASRNEVANIQIFDVLGKEIIALSNVNLDGFRLPSTLLPSKGIYFVNIENTAFKQTIKIVK